MEKILITGGSGLIGKAFSEKLSLKGYDVHHLTRKINNKIPYNQFIWDIDNKMIEPAAFENIAHIVHLAGENISNKTWTKNQKLQIEKSRINSALLLYQSCLENNCFPKSFISTSAIGYYGSFNSEKILTENDEPGSDFLAEICAKWESAADLFAKKGVRTIKIRTGVVLSKADGAYPKIVQAAKFGFAAALGTGRQYVPWIHIDDIVDIFFKAVEDKTMEGSYNGVAPEHITNKQLTAAIAKSYNKPFFLPNIPSFVIKATFGELSDIFLKGSRVSSQKIQQQGFNFKYPEIENALKNLVN